MPEQDDQFVQRRLLIASLISAAAIMAYFYASGAGFAPPVTQPEPTELTAEPGSGAADQSNAPPDPGASGAAGVEPVAAASDPTGNPGDAPPPDAILASSEREITVKTETVEVVFSNRGGVVKRWSLEGYNDAAGEPLDLLHQSGAAKFGYPFRLFRAGGEPFAELDDALFVVNEGPDRRGGGETLEFRYSQGGIRARKTFRFEREGFGLHVETEVSRDGAPVSHLIGWPGGFGDTGHLQDSYHSSVYYWDPANQGLERNSASDAEDARLTNQGAFPFVGIDDLFFTASFTPSDERTVRMETSAVMIAPIEGTDDEELFPALAVGSPAGNSFDLYVGPKSLDGLRKIDTRMGEIVDFGWFGFIAEPLFLMLRWVHANVVPNWGWSIIFLTVFINFILFPLKWKGSKSMKRMQQIQPLVKQINEKYKGMSMKDPRKQEQNEELMALYKKYKVNPVGGCLPMILQLPFFYGFYKVLTVAIEMRGAEWMWVSDLSQPEQIAIRVLPLAMMGSQFWMQSLTPTPSVDPAQARIMKFMPLMMGFIFYGFSAGLVLYWLTSNVVGVGQQVLLNKLPGEPLDLEPVRRGPSRKKKK